MSIHSIILGYIRSHAILWLLMIVLIITISVGFIVHLVEPETFPSVFDGIWWVIVTGSTVGYGDYVPESITGRIIGIFLILTGAGLISFYMVTLAASIYHFLRAFNEGGATYKGDNHIIIVGWNEGVKTTIDQLLHFKDYPKIVLIDQTLEEKPNRMSNVHFVKGDPTKDETLKKAGVNNADTILITADQHKNEYEADMSSVLTLLAVKGLNPSLYSFVEILTPEQVNNAKRAGADELIETNKIFSFLLTNSLVSHGMSDLLSSILDQLRGSRMRFIQVPSQCLHKTFNECLLFYLKEETLLIGIKRGEEQLVNPPLSTKIKENDELLIIQR